MVVIGLARTGQAVARALHAEGLRVLVVDRADTPALRERAAALPHDVEVRLGGYSDDVAAGAAMVSPSPGVPWDAPELERARALGVPIRSEMDLFLERCPARVAGITGTNGKTTVTSLVAAILQRAGERVHLGGNIGVPMLDRLGDIGSGDWVVLELSSFQIESIARPTCSIACVLNVTPDHLDRHRTFQRYVDIKGSLVAHARDEAVLGYDDAVTRDMAQLAKCPVRYFGRAVEGDGATVQHADVVSVEQGEPRHVLPVAEIPLYGDHNVLNVLAAVALSRAAGATAADIAAAVRDFHAVQHRLEVVLDSEGILWVNDSKATNAESAVMALRSFPGRSIVWIGGGKAAGVSSDMLADEVAARARHAVLNGESAAELEAALRDRKLAALTVARSLQEAVEAARALAQPGDVVLFAPGYKSFDQFRDFEHRGEVFTTLVRSTTTVGGRR